MDVCISVIVPVYRVENYIHECVDSILAQTYTDFELILVDDGSPDNCGGICDEYAAKDSRIRVIHQENSGVSAARNAGLDIAKGEYLTFIDSDDCVAETFLQTLIDAMDEYTDITICSFHTFQNKTKLPAQKKNSDISYTTYSPENIVFSLYDRSSKILAVPWAKLYRTSIIGNQRFPVGRIHEDQAYIPIVCYNARQVIFCDIELYFYRERAESITNSKFSVQRYDDIWARDLCIQYFSDEGQPQLVETIKQNRHYRLCSYAILARRDHVPVPKEYKVNLLRAVISLRKLTSDSYFEYYLAQIHPKLAVAHEYFRKVKRVLNVQSRKKGNTNKNE